MSLPDSIQLYDVPWSVYFALRSIDMNRGKKMTFNRGMLTLETRVRQYERDASLLDFMVRLWARKYDIPLEGLGKTTFLREDLELGLEPSSSFYLENYACMMGHDDFDLMIHPAPDLVIEVQAPTTPNRLPIYAEFGVREVWHWKDDKLQVLLLDSNATYHERHCSLAARQFPIAATQEILHNRFEMNETVLADRFIQALHCS